MKPEQDTATKADIGLETNDFGDRWSTRKMVRDKWWETSQSTEKTSGEPGTTRRCGRQIKGDKCSDTSKEPDTSSQRGSQMTGSTQRVGHEYRHTRRQSLGVTWRETSEEERPESRTWLDEWRETSEERHPKSWTPPARLGDSGTVERHFVDSINEDCTLQVVHIIDLRVKN